MKNEIGKRVAALRKEIGKSQGEVAKWLDVDVRTYRTREQGNYFFPVPELVQLADLLGVSLDYLLTGKTGGEELIEEEQRLLRCWRLIGDTDKRFILSNLSNAMAERLENCDN